MSLRKNTKLQKGKSKLKKNVNSEDEDSEHELSYYLNDRIRLMKQVLKLMKPKKIKAMAPDCIKGLDLEEINSMLLEELLGISKKRLKHIINGEPADDESSATEEEEPIDIISLDDITDSEDDFNFGGKDVKTEPGNKNVKKEKGSKSKKDSNAKDNLTENEKVMSVLELLELQARARAIRSQLAIENANKNEKSTTEVIKNEEESDSDAIIVESPRHEEIVIDSSGSDEESKKIKHKKHKSNTNNDENIKTKIRKTQKIKIIRDDKVNAGVIEKAVNQEENIDDSQSKNCDISVIEEDKKLCDNGEIEPLKINDAKIDKTEQFNNKSDDDEIVINVDQAEIDGIVNV